MQGAFSHGLRRLFGWVGWLALLVSPLAFDSGFWFAVTRLFFTELMIKVLILLLFGCRRSGPGQLATLFVVPGIKGDAFVHCIERDRITVPIQKRLEHVVTYGRHIPQLASRQHARALAVGSIVSRDEIDVFRISEHCILIGLHADPGSRVTAFVHLIVDQERVPAN